MSEKVVDVRAILLTEKKLQIAHYIFPLFLLLAPLYSWVESLLITAGWWDASNLTIAIINAILWPIVLMCVLVYNMWARRKDFTKRAQYFTFGQYALLLFYAVLTIVVLFVYVGMFGNQKMSTLDPIGEELSRSFTGLRLFLTTQLVALGFYSLITSSHRASEVPVDLAVIE